MHLDDTIVALATPAGTSARAIVRTSGPRALELAAALGDLRDGHGYPRAARTNVRLADDGGLDVPATLLLFAGPRSSTGEDVAEYHVPGSPFLIGRLLARLFALGARQAQAGEFSARAFFNGKLDLAAAEGVVATIAASNRVELDAARRLLSGELARRLAAPTELLAKTLALVEVGIDFSGEDVSFIAREQVVDSIEQVDRELSNLIDASGRFERIVHHPRIVLAGRPNAGKSTLLNALAGSERAVVSDAAGTTRDPLSTPISLPSGRATLVDVAGLDGDEQDAGAPGVEIAEQMASAARRAIATADVVVHVIDATDDRRPLCIEPRPHLIVRTKIDLRPEIDRDDVVAVSVATNLGLDELRERLDELAFGTAAGEGTSTLALNSRHLAELGAARISLDRAATAIDRGPEIVAFELRVALDDVGRILGSVSPDDVLGRIFSTFCIGK